MWPKNPKTPLCPEIPPGKPNSRRCQEAVYNSLTRAMTITGFDGHRTEAIPLDKLRETLND